MNIDQNHIAELINQPLTQENLVQIQSSMSELAPVDIGNLLTSTPAKERQQLWDLFDEDLQGEVVAYVDPDLVADLFSERSAEEIAQVIEKVADSDDLADIIQLMPDDLGEEILIVLDSQDRERVETLLLYPRDTAGGLMDTDIISVRSEVSIDVVLRYLRRHQKLPDATDQIFVVDKQGFYAGCLPLATILVTDPRKLVSECLEQNIEGILADLPTHEVAQLFERYDLISIPVLDQAGLLLGRITIDDIVDVIIDEADHSILGMAGLNQIDDTLAPILKTSRSRALWLGANLMTALIASFVINLFEDTIEKVVALAILMPIVASMGGVTGSQSLTLVIRSMAQGTLLESNMGWLVRRELAVSVLNGIVWASLIAIGTAILFNDKTLGMIIAIALVINMAVAAVSGAILPRILKSLNIDPAIAGTVVLTTITDVVGFLTFLGMATYFYA
jgi:magnesium transporter